ncbi:carbon-nitrogen hydrolase family protein [Amycolatopsis sp. NPDC059657]|uniref:carbon-nitrogen hydrolase family protein n=1 Tax=Amycolatopsis sp. NPDC059657 TaxID=3346899 RepID=UPI00366C5E3A
MIIAVQQGPYSALTEAGFKAAGAGADLLICAEMITTGYNIGAAVHERAEPADGPTAERVAKIANGTGVAIAYGYPERVGEKVFNSVQLIDAQGTRIANYRKTHLFGELDKNWFTPGDEAVVQTEFGGLTVGFLICYDVEFPELVRAHALAGTELLIVPTALMSPYELVADTVVRSRAYESQLYVAYANRCDVEAELDYCGRSSVVSPTGDVLAKAGGGEELLIATVDRATLRHSRTENTHLADRRPELYPLLNKGTTS